jgi:hypothetical protein
MSTTNLYAYRREACLLVEALDAVKQDLSGFAFSPARFLFLSWVDAKLETGRPDDKVDQIYEARMFEPESVELRWLRDPNDSRGRGSAVLVSEEALELPGWRALPTLSIAMALDRQRLCEPVAGEPADRRKAWSRFDAPRHGSLSVPVRDATPGSHLVLKVREYIGTAAAAAGEDGNQQVLEERMLGWAVVTKESVA